VAIIDPHDRPAVPVEQGTFAEPPSGWELLEDHRERIDRAISCVGRLEVEGHPLLQWVGVGTLVGPYQFLTARHAIELFARGRGDSRVTLKPGMRAFLTSGPATGSATSFKLPVTAVRFLHPFLDVALCQLGPGQAETGEDDAEIDIPVGLTMAAEEPAPLVGRKVAVIGFAAMDVRNDRSAIEKVYGPTLRETLYLQPGEITSPRSGPPGPVISHDCTTLGGAAGAPLLDLETGQMLGVHHSGIYLSENRAVPGWDLARDRRVRSYGIQFSDDPDWMYKWALAEREAAVTTFDDEPQPEPDPQLEFFKLEELYAIRDLLDAVQLTREDRQHLLFLGMSNQFIGTLPIDKAPDARLMQHLSILNRTPRLTSGELPMRTLVYNAVENSKQFPQSAKLREYLDRLPEA
jgi:hypothetical protein